MALWECHVYFVAGIIFGELPFLTTLDLSNNQLTSLRGLSLLPGGMLNASYNKLHHLPCYLQADLPVFGVAYGEWNPVVDGKLLRNNVKMHCAIDTMCKQMCVSAVRCQPIGL